MVLPSLQDSSPEVTPPEAQGRVVMTKVFVTGLKVEAEIGVYAHEKGKVQPLVVDVELDVPIAGATRLADTVNYEMIGEAARAIVAEGHIQLVEDFAERLARACLSDLRVTRARVRVEKLDVFANAASVGVEIERYAATI